MALDPRLNAYREDITDARLRGQIKAGRFVEGRPARVVVGRAPVRRVLAAEAPLDTYYHYGDPVLVFEKAGGWAWCQSLEDGYVGYVEAPQNAIGEPAEPTHFAATMGSYLYAKPDMKSPPVDFLQRHSAGVVLGCSGLVQNAFRDLGIIVLRDTDMQRDAIGKAVAIGSAAELVRGDLLYMPGHVLIYAGDGVVIHASDATMWVRRQALAEFMAGRGFENAPFVRSEGGR